MKASHHIAVLPGETSLKATLGELGKTFLPSHVKATDLAQNDRYVVAVERGAATHYYAPLVRTIDAGLAKSGKKKRGKAAA